MPADVTFRPSYRVQRMDESDDDEAHNCLQLEDYGLEGVREGMKPLLQSVEDIYILSSVLSCRIVRLC